ncbi:MAG TPA: RNA polymerase sigma factor [Candidatus Babeliales bacterium]|nr:RNA polymerase sigma factor [Candidatus Babeliales bacterium]
MTTNGLHAEFVDRLERHRGILLKVAGAYCHRLADREDLVQEMIVALWRAYGGFGGRAAFSTWMYRIAVNVAISFRRREARRPHETGTASDAILQLTAPEPETDESLAALRALIGELDPLNRALMLLYLDDCPQAEIAEILGISATNVATKIGRIKERLKREAAGRSYR